MRSSGIFASPVDVEAEEAQVEAGDENADVASNRLAARQDDCRLGEALDLAGLHLHRAGAKLFFEADRHGDSLLPRVVARGEMRCEGRLADGAAPVAAEKPAREAREAA